MSLHAVVTLYCKNRTSVRSVVFCAASRVVAKSAEGKDALRAKASEVEFSGRHLLTDGANAWYLTLKGNPPRSSSLRISLRGPVSSKSAVPSPSPNPGKRSVENVTKLLSAF